MAEAERRDSFDARTPIAAAAESILRARLGRVRSLLSRAAEQTPTGREDVHELRVATRRASAALDAFAPWLDDAKRKRLQRRLRRIRRAAGAARDADVHAQLIDELTDLAPEDLLPALDYLRDRISLDRDRAAASLTKLARKRGPGRTLRRSAAAPLIRRGDEPLCGHAIQAALTPPSAALGGAAQAPLSSLENLHALRLSAKRLRYALEIFRPCLDAAPAADLIARLEELQSRLGAVNDIDGVIRRIEREARELDGATPDGGVPNEVDPLVRPGLQALLARYVAVRGRRHAEAIEWVDDTDVSRIAADLRTLLGTPGEAAPPARGEASLPPTARTRPEPSRPPAEFEPASTPPAWNAPQGPQRVAAIDIGTNSIRLLVAEVHPDGTYRSIDDERDPARIGRGLVQTGLIAERALIRAAESAARMAEIARGLGVSRIRVVGTSAVRDAKNSHELVALVRERTGLELEIISAEEEGRLAFVSAAHAFDLGSVTSGVADTGGGSTQIVLSAGGVTDQIYTLPLGAVRLTEMFGGPEEASGPRFKEMRRHIKRTLRRMIGQRPFVPQTMIGTGGTFTTLANILTQQETGSGGPALPWRAAPGHEVLRAEARHLLDRLRKMPVHERSRIHGLPPERADIFVAGLTVVECLLRHMRVNAVRIHDRGIRDGLVLTMGREIFGVPSIARRRPDPVRSARRFAETCRYERPHSEHVTRLALRLFDQLAAAAEPGRPWATPEARRLLEAAGVLHDVGYLVNYAQHHKHSYHLIVHADLPGFTRREIQIVANVARYHRKAPPSPGHADFAALPAPDRRLVRALAAILRIADGLDRTHTQNVADVSAQVRGDRLLISAAAEHDPATDLWGSQRKSRLFERVFGLKVELAWARAAAPAETPAPPSTADALL